MNELKNTLPKQTFSYYNRISVSLCFKKRLQKSQMDICKYPTLFFFQVNNNNSFSLSKKNDYVITKKIFKPVVYAGWCRCIGVCI